MAPYDVKRYCLLYFAYGSNMDESEMKSEGKCPSALCTGTGYLVNKRLVFNKKSIKWNCAGNITTSYRDSVYGVLYDITNPDEWLSLERAEHGYRPVNVRVRVLPDRRIMDAVSFEAEPEAVVTDGTPGKSYMEKLIAGACEHHFPEDYVRFLRSFAATGRDS